MYNKVHLNISVDIFDTVLNIEGLNQLSIQNIVPY